MHAANISRIIPAYAGSTGSSPPGAGRGWDHPRIRGEHASACCGVDRFSGSSPHTRGAQRCETFDVQRRGIIPAYAGSTAVGARWWRRQGDHPRIRGEHMVRFRRFSWLVGSSPHTRGARVRVIVEQSVVGIIPAYAGSTSTVRKPASTATDHPRIRGEHTWKSLQYQGSPP